MDSGVYSCEAQNGFSTTPSAENITVQVQCKDVRLHAYGFHAFIHSIIWVWDLLQLLQHWIFCFRTNWIINKSRTKMIDSIESTQKE